MNTTGNLGMIMKMMMNAGIGTAITMAFGLVPDGKLLMVFGAMTVEEAVRMHVLPTFRMKMQADGGLLDQTPMTVRQPSSATVRAGGNSSFFGGFPSGF